MTSREWATAPPPAWRVLVLLILAGEAAYTLPFHVARFFRPSLLTALELSNAELGMLQSAYGLTAMLSYFPGGLVADRLPARALLSLSLGLTALGGLYYATLPSFAGLMALHLYWGVTTTLLFWGALIRATRDSHSPLEQGRAFGLLEGGRGLLAAVIASVGLALLSQGDAPLDVELRDGRMRQIILLYTGVTACLAAACYFGLRDLRQDLASPADPAAEREHSLSSGAPIHWWGGVWHGLLIVVAYCGYKGIDFYSTYATQVLGQDEVAGAGLATLSVWLRAPAAVIAGVLADKKSASRMTVASLAFLGGGFALLATPGVSESTGGSAPASVGALVALATLTLLTTSALLYGIRGLYFALLQERRVPGQVTGTVVGLISVIGYTPDFFFPALAGWLIDSAPRPAVGYARFFGLLSGMSLLGTLLVGRGLPAEQSSKAPPRPTA